MAWLKGRFVYAYQGLKYGFCKDRSIRAHAFFSILVIVAGLFFRLTMVEWFWIALAIALVLSAEFFNSAIEKTVDYISLERNPLAGQIKDLWAAAVSMICIFAVIIGLSIFGPYLLNAFSKLF